MKIMTSLGTETFRAPDEALGLAVHEDVHATSRVRAVGDFLDELFASASGRLTGTV